jgi:HlyD family secretion protein
VEEQRVNIIGDFVDSPKSLGDAYRIEANIITWQSQNVLKVPLSGLFRCNSGWCVFIVQDGQAQKRSLQINHRSDFAAEVQSGLSAGEQVILHPNEQIGSGKRVRSH